MSKVFANSIQDDNNLTKEPSKHSHLWSSILIPTVNVDEVIENNVFNCTEFVNEFAIDDTFQLSDLFSFPLG